MFVVLLATTGPFFVLELAFVFGLLFRGVTFPPPHASAAQTAAYQAALNAHMLDMMSAVYRYWYVSFPLMIAVLVVFYGLATGAQCFGYRSLTENETLDPIAAD